MSACRYVVPFLLLAFAGCTDDGGERTEATRPAGTPEQPTTAEPAQRRPVRLLPLGRFAQPTYITAPRGDRRRFVVEREGRIRVVQRGRILGRPFLDISDRVTSGGESGLLSMAFAPDYARSPRFWVYYTDNQGFIQIDQFRTAAGTPNRADPGSRRSVIRVPHRRSNHKGGQLQVGPDGMLYAGFGDGGGGGDPDENAQDLGELLGKLIRIDPRPDGGYSIPASNPFRGRSGSRGEIYAYGLRNPYRFSFDRRRGHLTIGDVGQNAIEEIDFVPGRSGGAQPRGGYNFGWDAFEGRATYEGGTAPGHVRPVLQHSHSASGYCSITGGYVMRDRSLGRGWTGRYVYGDYCNGRLRVSHLRRPTARSRRTRLSVSNLVSFGEDGRGRVYAVSLDGPVFRIGRR
ncbi:MAG TPA: PQQ-dependent sugar dehydrogenase [Thermoleophilaceae bacterium]|nr:PQQ-dependent sugar dehydrogenase [Thermoleophilaceae bacterium]